MNVTTANFNEFFDEFKQYLPQARFLSFDFEMTGIATAKESGQDLWWDLPFERYGKVFAIFFFVILIIFVLDASCSKQIQYHSNRTFSFYSQKI